MQEEWDQRYSAEEFAYGKTPNLFFKKWLEKYEPRSILMPADGEGRNGVYAATQGWDVTSFDFSVEGQSKALRLAVEYDVNLKYMVGDLDKLDFIEECYDVIGLIYAHFAPTEKSRYHKQLTKFLKKGGVVIFEAFSKNHLHFNKLYPQVGGPKDLDMLFSKDEILSDFKGFEILYLDEEEVVLDEGKFHIGTGSVVRFVGRKK